MVFGDRRSGQTQPVLTRHHLHARQRLVEMSLLSTAIICLLSLPQAATPVMV